MDAVLRSAVYGLLMRRDGFAGWRRHRARFRELAALDLPEVERRLAADLSRIMRHAYDTVPYYRDLWTAIGFRPSRHVSLEEMRQLPLLTKDHIRGRKEELASRRYDKKALSIDYTGGTTGTQVSFYRDHECGVAKFGRQLGVLERCGYRPGDRRGLIWGAHRDFSPEGRPTLKGRVREFGTADEILCCTAMTRADMEEYHRRLLRFRPRVLYGYPNAIHQYARLIKEEGLRRLRVDRVICTAELLTETQRSLMTEVFGGEVFNIFGSRDHGIFGFECARHDGFHIDVGNVFLEIIRDGRPAQPGETGEIVITDLLNYGMPLIRHATADMAGVSSGACSCGLTLPLIESVEGRVTDVLYRPDGKVVAGLMLMDLFADLDPVRAAQFVQTKTDALEVNVVLAADLTPDLRARLIHETCQIMGDEIAIDVRVVPDIPRNPRSGKYQEVICLVGRAAGDPADGRQ